MTQTNLQRRQLITGLALISLPLCPPPALAAPARHLELRRLLKLFQNSSGIEANFVEEKQIALLNAPLRKSGKIYFHPPASLARIIEKPRRSHLVIKGNRIIARDDNGRRSIDLSDKPSLRGLISSLIHILGGNEKQLLEHYSTTMTGSATENWQLSLIPRDKDLRAMIQSFSLTGKSIILSELIIKEANGDKAVSRFTHVVSNRKFSATEIARYFDI